MMQAILPEFVDSPQHLHALLRTWVHRFASQGVQGLVDRPRPGRPPKVPCALAYPLDHLVDQDPLQHGSSHSPWRCQALANRPRPPDRSPAESRERP